MAATLRLLTYGQALRSACPKHHALLGVGSLYSVGAPYFAGLEEKMQMRIVSKMALAIALGGMAVAAPAYAAKKEDKPAPAAKATPAVQKAAYDAQKAADAGDFPTALTNYATAKAAIVSDDDKMMVGQVGYHIYQKNKG